MNNKSVAALFEENELNISLLYCLYAEKIPGKNKFWKDLAAQEVGHAAEIRSQMSGLADGIIAEGNFSLNIIDYVMKFVLDEIKKVKSSKIDHRYAVLTALRVERSMLEKKLFDIFIPTSETVQSVMQKMNKETERHVQILLAEMKKCKYSF